MTQLPRDIPDRDSRYMGLAWIQAGFSKDPTTQVGAILVSCNNIPMGSGYNGPPSNIHDFDVSWERPKKEDVDKVNKYDLIIHAEINAMKFSQTSKESIEDSTLYVTALPCPACMLKIVHEKIKKVIYFDFQGSNGSILQDPKKKEKTFEIAKLGSVKLEKFQGNVNWLLDWCSKLKDLDIFA